MKKAFTSILLLAALSVPAYLSASAWLEGDGGEPAEQTTTIEVDYTSKVKTDGWKDANGNNAGVCATQFAPAITTKDGRNAQLAENYQTNVNATGDILLQTVTGLANGTYRVSIYANAFYTSGRGFESDMEDGAEDVCYVFAGSGENRKEKFITARIATSTTENDLRSLEDVVVTDGTLVIGLGKAKAGTNWHTVQVYEVTAIVDATELLNTANENYEAVKDLAMQKTVKDALNLAKTAVDAEVTSETLTAFNNAISAAQSSAEAYAAAKSKLDNMKALLDANNVYTAEALENYYGKWAAAFENQTLTVDEGNALQDPFAPAGWHSANLTVDDLLLSAWTIGGEQAHEYDKALYINTWSTEGNNDGTEFRVPFFEYWTNDGNSLGANTLTATLTGVEEGLYEVSAWVRVRAKNGTAADDATGISLNVNGGTATDVTEGALVGESQFNIAEYKAYGQVGEDGNLAITFTIDAENNISWLSFKNVKFKKTSAEEIAYEKALAAIKDGEGYRIFTEINDTKYYLNTEGKLTDADNAATFIFNKVEVANTLYQIGWNLGAKFTNPQLTNGSSGDVVNNGKIEVGGNDRNDWERQVMFLNDEGKFAVRATNANSANWGANTYWDVVTNDELPAAGYSLEPSYVWQIAGYVDLTELNTLADKLLAQIAATETYDDPQEVGVTINSQIETIKNKDFTSKKEVDAAIGQIAELAKSFFNGIKAKSSIDVTDWYIVNPAPMNKNGWEGTDFGTASDGVCEYWNKSGADFHQAIEIPAGLYRLTAVALQRTGMSGVIYAGEHTVEIAQASSAEANNRSQAANWFAAGNGVNEIFFETTEAGPITIGLTADNANGDHWTVWKNFKLEMIADIPVDVVYNLVNGENILATETITQLPGDEVKIPGAFANATHGLFALTADVEAITKETTVVNVTATWAGPFEFSTDIENAKWYNMNIRGGWQVSKCETEPYTMKQNATEEELATPEFQWAFLPVANDPYKVIIVNKASEGQSLTPADVPEGEGTRHAVVLRDGDFAWEIFANGDGFVLREPEVENGWVNQAGGGTATSPLAFWVNANGKSDGGSTFRVNEVPFVILDNMPLTKDMFKNWIGFDATAEPTETTPYWDAAELGAEHSAGNTIYGSGNVANTDFADVTGAEALRIEGTAGIQLRVLINRQEDNSLIEINPVIGEDGYVDVDLTSYEYVHINAIKLGWSSPAGSVTALILNPTAAEPAGDTYAGIIMQSQSHPQAGPMGDSTSDQTVTITEAGEGLVNITFSGFALPMAALGSFAEFTIENVAVTEYEGVTVYLAEDFQVPISGGQMTSYYNGTLIGAQETAESTPVIKLILQNATTDVCYFGANEEDINRFKAQEPKEALKTYDLTANDVEVSDWSTITIADATIISEAATLLGAQPSELIYQLVDTTGVRKDYNGNEGEVLFWVDYNGNKSNWGVNNKYYISYDAETPAITVTQFGAEYSKTLNAVVRLENADGDFVEFKINVTMEDVPVINPEIVKTIEIEGFDLAETAYNADENHLPTFDVAEVCTALGIDNISNAETYIVNVTTGEFVKNTTDGWRNADGDATAWGQATNGYCLKLNDPASGQFDYSGAHDANFAAGDTYLAQWAIVAGEKAVLLKVTINFLSQDDYNKATGINGIAADVENGKVFNIAGQKTGRVQKGVNIIGGKKVYVK